MRIVLLNLGSVSAQDVQTALSGQGYEVASEPSLSVDEILVTLPGTPDHGGNAIQPQLLRSDQPN